jgi:eukaryotic-like serine/threonine-protein kinase
VSDDRHGEEHAAPDGDRPTVVMAEEASARPAELSREEEIAEAEKLVGRVISKRYRILELIAAGGMGAVFRGEHVHMRHRVAIKVLLPRTEGLPDLVARFEREAIAGAHVRHPNVAAATDFGRDENDNYFLVTEYARGETLADVMDEGPLAVERAVHIARELAAALVAVHEKGIVHRDIKPLNVVLSEEDGSVKLIDFGFAKVDVDRLSVDLTTKPADPARTAVGIVLGTVPYMAPEIAKGMDALDARADLYALGIMLYEMLAGKHPFAAKTQAELFAAHLSELPPPIAVRAPGVVVPPAVEAVVMALLAKKPDERFQSASAVINALDAALAEPPPPSLPTPRRAPPSDPTAMAKPEAPTRDATVKQREPTTAEATADSDEAPKATGKPKPAPTAATKRSPFAVLARWRPPFDVRRVALYAGPPLVLLLLAVVVILSATDDAPPPASEPSRRDRASPEREGDGEPSTTAEAPKPPGPGAAEARRELLAARSIKSWVKGAEALTTLAQEEPRAFEEDEIREAAAAVAVGMATGGDDLAEPVFAVLTGDMGEPGLGVLWEIVRTKGGTRAQQRAIALMRNPEIAERTPPPLRIAFDLRMTPCDAKEPLFAEAAEIGDHRALQELQILAHAKCKSPHHGCCFRENAAIRDAIAALEKKIGK